MHNAGDKCFPGISFPFPVSLPWGFLKRGLGEQKGPGWLSGMRASSHRGRSWIWYGPERWLKQEGSCGGPKRAPGHPGAGSGPGTEHPAGGGGHTETLMLASPQSVGATAGFPRGLWASPRLPQGKAGAARGSLWGLGEGVGSRLHWRGFGARGQRKMQAKHTTVWARCPEQVHMAGHRGTRLLVPVPAERHTTIPAVREQLDVSWSSAR